MGVILGIDIGGSTTKIAGYHDDSRRIGTLQVVASDRITSLYGAIGNLLSSHSIALSSVSRIVITGVGAELVDGDMRGIKAERVNEFDAIGLGGLALSGKSNALVVSMGTGTAFVMANENGSFHIGGSGVGGGTLTGLSWHLFHENDINTITELAKSGSLEAVDLMISDICVNDISSLPSHATASNFGSIKSGTTSSDLSLGLMNMVFQTVGMLSVFALRNESVSDVVVIGSLATLPQARAIFNSIEELYSIKFFIPDEAVFATAIGAALPYINNI